MMPMQIKLRYLIGMLYSEEMIIKQILLLKQL
jgi:hypothetical protein